MEELEQAMKKYNMGDDKSIKEIIAEVDTDRVCLSLLLFGFGPSIYGIIICLLNSTLFSYETQIL